MDEQTTFRLPRELSRTLSRVAKERGVPKSHLVREALERYLYPEPGAAEGWTLRERSAPLIGSIRLESSAPGADDVAGLIRARNWREQMARERDILLDTGPLVALLDAADARHRDCLDHWNELGDRCLTTEAVLTEATHLVARGGADAHIPLDFVLAAGIPIVGLERAGHDLAARLMRRFRNVPMDYADATLVVTADALKVRRVFTLDRRGFSTYRRGDGARFAIAPQVASRACPGISHLRNREATGAAWALSNKLVTLRC